MKNLFKDKALWICFTILFVLLSISMDFFVLTHSDLYNTYVSSYSFWLYVRYEGIGVAIMFLSVILVSIGCTYTFYKKLHNGQVKNIFLEILNCSIKSIILLPVMSIIALLIGKILYSSSIFDQSYLIYGAFFPSAGLVSPLRYVLLCTLLSLIFSVFIINVTIIFSKMSDKFWLVELVTFFSINVLNYILDQFIPLIINHFMKKDIYSMLNIYNGYQP